MENKEFGTNNTEFEGEGGTKTYVIGLKKSFLLNI